VKRSARPKAPGSKSRGMAPPRLARTVAVLQRLDGDADPAVIEKQADLIHQAWLDMIVGSRSRGHDIGVDDGGIAYARPRSKTKGLKRELDDLLPKCRKAVAGRISLREWTTIWAAQPHRIRKLWKPKLIKTAEGRTIDRSTIAMSFVADGYVIVVPKPGIVLPVIEAALANITASPRSKKREPNAVEAKAIEAIRDAYRAITGNKGGRAINVLGKLDGKLAALGREIDAIFGTKLIAEKDSWRLR
jgi:hypothetical protein